MLQNALNMIRGRSNEFGTKIDSIVNKGFNAVGNIGRLISRHSDKVPKIFNVLHGIADLIDYPIDRVPIQFIPPKQNAAYGVGTLGPRELAPAFIGDRQENAEEFEIIARNPRSRTQQTYIRKKKKIDTRKVKKREKMPTTKKVVIKRKKKVPVVKKVTSSRKIKAPQKIKKRRKYKSSI